MKSERWVSQLFVVECGCTEVWQPSLPPAFDNKQRQEF
jgi:hypothetical protein